MDKAEKLSSIVHGRRSSGCVIYAIIRYLVPINHTAGCNNHGLKSSVDNNNLVYEHRYEKSKDLLHSEIHEHLFIKTESGLFVREINVNTGTYWTQN